MSKLTIAQRRELQLEQFNNKYIHNYEEAKKLFNSYYRYVGLHARLFEAENDSVLYNSPYYKSLKEQESKRYDSLKDRLSVYAISIYIPWTIPYLGIKDAVTGGITENVIDPILYN